MHKFYQKKYYFISEYDTNLIDNLDKSVNIIYRNYRNKIDIQQIQKLGNYCKKKGNKFYLSNNFKIALNLNLDGVYLPSFNNSYKHLSYSLKKSFKIIGSAHSLKETTIKKNKKFKIYSYPQYLKKIKIILE